MHAAVRQMLGNSVTPVSERGRGSPEYRGEPGSNADRSMSNIPARTQINKPSQTVAMGSGSLCTIVGLEAVELL